MFDDTQGVCWGYGNANVQPDEVCDSWAPEPTESKLEVVPQEVPMTSTATPPAPLATHTREWRNERAKAISDSQRRRAEQRQTNAPLELREEIRLIPMEERVAGGPTEKSVRILRSYASLFDTPYSVGSSGYRYEERVNKGAFKRSLGRQPDVVFRYDHSGPPLARTTSGTLRLGEDSTGLWYEADLNPEDPDVQALLPKISRGDLSESSFAFRAIKDTWNEDSSKRSLDECELDRGDVSVVTFGASRATGKHLILRSEELADLREEGFERFLEAWTEWRDFTLLSQEERVGKVISGQSMTTLRRVLDLFATADEAVDEGQALLSDLMGVPNPNENEIGRDRPGDDGDGNDNNNGDLTSSEQLQHLSERGAGRDGDRLRTPAHLLDATLVDLGHLQRHMERFGEPEVQKDLESIGFNAEHGMNHVTSAQDHVTRLGEHLEQHASDPQVFRDERKKLTAMRADNGEGQETEYERASKMKTCPTCDGSGKIRGGNVTCPTCNGTGQVPVGTSGRAASSDEFWSAIREMAQQKGWLLRGGDGGMYYLEDAPPEERSEERQTPTAEDSAVSDALVKAQGALHDVMMAQKADPDNGYYDAEVWAHIEDAKNALDEAVLDQTKDQYGEDPNTGRSEGEVWDESWEYNGQDEEDRAALTSKARNNLPSSSFVFPKERRYPIHDIAHARNALARSSGKPEEAAVKRAVYKRYPSLKPSSKNSEVEHWEMTEFNQITDVDSLRRAISAAELADDPEVAKDRVKRCASKLNATSLLPESWRSEELFLKPNDDDELKFAFEVASRMHV